MGGDTFVSLRPQWWDHLTETRAIGPDPVAEDDAKFGLHECLSARNELKAEGIIRSCAISPLLSFSIAA
jgi:hypothetical protein